MDQEVGMELLLLKLKMGLESNSPNYIRTAISFEQHPKFSLRVLFV